MILLSACLIVKNEEKNLSNCLNSVKPFVDEIIIVDTGSKDKTIQIAESFGSKVIHINWSGNFSKARNEVLKHTSGKWILSIDADETLDASVKIRELLSNCPENIGGFFIERHNRFYDFGEKKLLTEARNNLRIFRNHPAVKWRRNVHEQISDSIIEAGFIHGNAPARIFHYINYLSEKELKEKHLGYLNLLAISLKENLIDFYSLFFRAQTYCLLERKEEAFTDLNQIIKSSFGNVLFLALNTLCAIYLEAKNLEEAMKQAEKSISLFPDQSWAYFLKANIHLELKEYEKALVAIDKTILSLTKIQEREKLGGDLFLLPEQKHCFKGNCFLRNGKLAKAEKEFEAGAGKDFNGNENKMGLAIISLIHGKKENAKKYLKEILFIEPEWKKAKDLLNTLH